VKQYLLALGIGLVVRLWLATLRVQRLGPPLVGPGLVAFWHGDQLPLLTIRPAGRLVAPISLSRDGRLQAAIMARFGIGDIPGSSSRGGASAARGLLRALGQGALALIAVDGPRGPRGQAQPGALFLARQTGLPLWPVGVAVRRGRRLRAWDRFLLPCPFTRTVVVVGEPLHFDRADHDPARLEAALRAAAQAAREAL
jgi:lysophospholipid acyltransferase (LPLAT)-like uncharacterized protein